MQMSALFRRGYQKQHLNADRQLWWLSETGNSRLFRSVPMQRKPAVQQKEEARTIRMIANTENDRNNLQ